MAAGGMRVESNEHLELVYAVTRVGVYSLSSLYKCIIIMFEVSKSLAHLDIRIGNE